jgi:hypothetical protein
MLVLVVLGGMVAFLLLRSSDRPPSSSSGGSVFATTAVQPIQINQQVNGELTSRITWQDYTLTLEQMTSLNISVTSSFDNYVEVYRGGTEEMLAHDDDSGDDRNALLNTTLPPGNYRIRVRPFSTGSGSFILVVTGIPMGQGPQVPTAPGVFPTYAPPVQPTMPWTGDLTPRTYPAVVTSARGPRAPVGSGATCSVQIEPHGGMLCHVVVTCSGQTIYGQPGQGFLGCRMTPNASGGMEYQGQDSNGTNGAPNSHDPRLDLDTAAQQVTVSDDVAGGTWTVVIRLNSLAQ